MPTNTVVTNTQADLEGQELLISPVDLASQVTGLLPSANLATTGVTAATYGDSTHVAQVAVNAQGQITSASNVAISGGGGTSGALVLLFTSTASAAATLDIATRNVTGQSGNIFQSDYDEYLLTLTNIIPSTNTQDLYMRVSTNNGSTYSITNGDYYYTNFYTALTGTGTVTGNPTAVGAWKVFTAISNLFDGVSGEIRIHNPLNTSYRKSLQSDVTASQGSEFYRIAGALLYNQTGAYNAIRFLYASGNINGTARVYGIAKS